MEGLSSNSLRTQSSLQATFPTETFKLYRTAGSRPHTQIENLYCHQWGVLHLLKARYKTCDVSLSACATAVRGSIYAFEGSRGSSTFFLGA